MATFPIAVDVTVVRGSVTDTLAGGFTYEAALTVTAITPTHGSTAGPTPVTATGSGFGADTTVTVDGESVAVTVVSPTEIRFTVPVQVPGTVTIVIASNGQSVSIPFPTYAVNPVVVDPDYAAYFLASGSLVVQLETLEIQHASFTQTYWIVRNKSDGLDANLENVTPYSGRLQSFEYYPLRIEGLGTRENLDFGLRVDLGDLGEVIPAEIDNVLAGGASSEKPRVTYRTYRSDDLSKPLYGPIELEIASISMKREGASFEAKAPSLNLNRTGETYAIDRFPSLRGLL